MPAVPIKDRWWQTKPKFDPSENWCTLWADQTPLNAAWHGMESLNDHYKNDAVNLAALAPHDPYVQDLLGSCPICDMWDRSAVSKPVDIPLMPTNKQGEVSPNLFSKLWMSHVWGTPVPMMHRKLFDAVSDDFDDDILVGEVYVLGGDRIPDLVSLLDRRHVPRRRKYAKGLFRHPSMSEFMPCHHCGRVLPAKCNPEYLLAGELESAAPRLLWGHVLLGPKTRRRCDFENKDKWPQLRIDEVPVLETPADPIPTPYPESWDELEASFAAIGLQLPARRISVNRTERPGPWLSQRIERLGKQLCHVPVAHDKYWTMVFFVRYRALFEKKVAERVDHWSDEELYDFVKDSQEFSRGLTSYFPV